MIAHFVSSGDLIADRRARYAVQLAQDGEHAAARDLLIQALERAPHWAAGWALRAEAEEACGETACAIAAWREVEAFDETGGLGASLRLERLGACPASGAAAHIEILFDQYAPRFDRALLGDLGYDGPRLLCALITDAAARLGLPRFARALDLGCGTGLMGERLRAHVDRLDGVDLSAGMLAEARRKDLYDGLEKAELLSWLGAANAPAALVTAADVLIYCGALPPVLAGVARLLAPGGLFAFSLEEHEGEEDMFLRPSLRYAHSRAGLDRALAQTGLERVAIERAMVRRDRGRPVIGLFVVARRAAMAANDTTWPSTPTLAEAG